MSLFKRLLKSIRYYVRGHGKPLRLILLWDFLFNIVAFVLGFLILFCSLFLIEISDFWLIQLLGAIIAFFGGVIGLMTTFIYPIVFIYALWKCAFNVKWEALGFLYGFFMFPFLAAHFFLGTYYLFGSLLMLYSVHEVFLKIFS